MNEGPEGAIGTVVGYGGGHQIQVQFEGEKFKMPIKQKKTSQGEKVDESEKVEKAKFKDLGDKLFIEKEYLKLVPIEAEEDVHPNRFYYFPIFA